MPRYFVYVNENPTEKHIKLHAESSKPCSEIFKNLHSGVKPTRKFEIVRLDPNTFKTAKTPNGYWLIVWAADLLAVFKNVQINI